MQNQPATVAPELPSRSPLHMLILSIRWMVNCRRFAKTFVLDETRFDARSRELEISLDGLLVMGGRSPVRPVCPSVRLLALLDHMCTCTSTLECISAQEQITAPLTNNATACTCGMFLGGAVTNVCMFALLARRTACWPMSCEKGRIQQLCWVIQL